MRDTVLAVVLYLGSSKRRAFEKRHQNNTNDLLQRGQEWLIRRSGVILILLIEGFTTAIS